VELASHIGVTGNQFFGRRFALGAHGLFSLPFLLSLGLALAGRLCRGLRLVRAVQLLPGCGRSLGVGAVPPSRRGPHLLVLAVGLGAALGLLARLAVAAGALLNW
jgi:hypothetical protein